VGFARDVLGCDEGLCDMWLGVEAEALAAGVRVTSVVRVVVKQPPSQAV
jgi:hypothetical protein